MAEIETFASLEGAVGALLEHGRLRSFGIYSNFLHFRGLSFFLSDYFYLIDYNFNANLPILQLNRLTIRICSIFVH